MPPSVGVGERSWKTVMAEKVSSLPPPSACAGVSLGVISIGLMVGWTLALIAFIIAVEVTEQKFYKQIFNFNISSNLSKDLNNCLLL